MVEEGECDGIPFNIYQQKHPPILGGFISARDFSILRCWEVTDEGKQEAHLYPFCD